MPEILNDEDFPKGEEMLTLSNAALDKINESIKLLPSPELQALIERWDGEETDFFWDYMMAEARVRGWVVDEPDEDKLESTDILVGNSEHQQQYGGSEHI